MLYACARGFLACCAGISLRADRDEARRTPQSKRAAEAARCDALRLLPCGYADSRLFLRVARAVARFEAAAGFAPAGAGGRAAVFGFAFFVMTSDDIL